MSSLLEWLKSLEDEAEWKRRFAAKREARSGVNTPVKDERGNSMVPLKPSRKRT